MARSKHRKSVIFKKGHPYYPQKKGNHDGANFIADLGSRNYQRLTREVYDLGVRDSDAPPSILRPICEDKEDTVDDVQDYSYLNENRLINMEEMGALMSIVYQRHLLTQKKCNSPDFRFVHTTEKLQGLGTSLETKCTKCSFTMEHFPLYKQLRLGQIGRPAAELNVRLGQYMATSEISHSSMRSLLSILDVNSPTEVTLQRNINKASEVNTDLSNAQIQKNQEMLQTIIEHMPDNSTEKAVISCDTMYNNPARGANRLPGTQSSTPFVEFTTKKKLIVGLETFTQICNKCGLGLEGKTHDACMRNYPSSGPMSQAEKMATAQFIDKLQTTPLHDNITHFLADGCNQVLSGVQSDNIERILCIQHVKRAQFRKYYKVAGLLSSGLFGTHDPNKKKNDMGNAIVTRCSIEFTRARRTYRNDSAFYAFCEKIRLNILECLSGDHSKCPSSSLVCRPDQQKQVTKNYGLTTSDVNILQAVIDYR